MHRSSVAKADAGKSRRGYYRVGQFVITRVGSRWRIGAHHSGPKKDLATLVGAVAWCQQQYAQPTRTKNPPHA
jgi:hypothetical protein